MDFKEEKFAETYIYYLLRVNSKYCSSLKLEIPSDISISALFVISGLHFATLELITYFYLNSVEIYFSIFRENWRRWVKLLKLFLTKLNDLSVINLVESIVFPLLLVMTPHLKENQKDQIFSTIQHRRPIF